MQDIVVIENLRKQGITYNDYDRLLIYEGIERKPRVLDKAPKRLSLQKAQDIKVYGCCSELIMTYNDLKGNIKLEQAVVDLKGVKRFCDVEVYIMLQALILHGITYTAERASACFDVFRVIATAPGDTITVNRVYDALSSYQPTSYQAGEIVKAIYVCLFDEKAPVLYWVSLCEFNGFYPNAIELGKKLIRDNCDTERDVEKFLRPIYKEAKEDTAFMDKLYKPATNKWLIPVLYKLYVEHPEVMETGGKGGFT